MKRIILFFTVFVISGILPAQEFPAECYTILVGKNASVTGSVMLAHNEDDGGDLIVNLRKIPAQVHNEKFLTLTNGLKIPQVKETYSYIWIETTRQKFGDFFMNEWGVTICSDACSSREDTAKGQLDYDLRKIIAERSTSARNAVHIAGSLIEKYGYNSSGRTYCIADAYEAWMLAVVRGKRWVAQRVPDDEVAIIPNYYTIEEIDLEDTLNFLASPDIIDYAVLRGWYDPLSGKPFNFREAYSTTLNLYAFWNIPRHWIGLNLLSGKKYGLYDHFPFSFEPEHKISKDDLKRVLSNHYEGTDFQVNYNVETNPHKNMINRVCNYSTKFSVIAELHNTYPENNQNVLWFAPMNPCVNPYVPIAFVIDSFPSVYKNRPDDKALEYHFDDKTNIYETNENHAYAVFNRRMQNINADYEKNSQQAKKFKKDFENYSEKIFRGYHKGKVSYDLLMKLYDDYSKN